MKLRAPRVRGPLGRGALWGAGPWARAHPAHMEDRLCVKRDRYKIVPKNADGEMKAFYGV